MVGIDLVLISRFSNKEDKFAKRFLSDNEFLHYKNLEKENLKTKFLASMWALKEAIFKADNSQTDFNKIELIKKQKRWTYDGFNLSLSHEADMLIAIAIKK